MKSIGLTIIGDSIIKNKKKDKLYDWSKQLTKKLKTKIKVRIFVKKKIIHGINSRGILNLLPDYFYKIDKKFKNFLIFQVGINDSWYYNSLKGLACVPKSSFEKNLNEIYIKSKICGFQKIYFVNYHKIHKLRKDGNGKTPNQNLNEYNRLINKFCNKKNLNLINITKFTSKHKKEILLNDGVHLNMNGVKLYSEIIYNEISKNIWIK